MTTQNQASFIPKDNATKMATRTERGMGLLMLLSLILLGLSLLLFAGAYGYRYVLDTQVNRPCTGDGSACGLKATVENTKKTLNVEEITRYSRLDKKMKVAEGLINKHITLIPFLDTLEELTIQTLGFNKMTYAGNEQFNLQGMANSYTDLAAQLKVYEQSQKVKSAVFSNLGLDKSGNVTFALSLTLTPGLLIYNGNQF